MLHVTANTSTSSTTSSTSYTAFTSTTSSTSYTNSTTSAYTTTTSTTTSTFTILYCKVIINKAFPERHVNAARLGVRAETLCREGPRPSRPDPQKQYQR